MHTYVRERDGNIWAMLHNASMSTPTDGSVPIGHIAILYNTQNNTPFRTSVRYVSYSTAIGWKNAERCVYEIFPNPPCSLCVPTLIRRKLARKAFPGYTVLTSLSPYWSQVPRDAINDKSARVIEMVIDQFLRTYSWCKQLLMETHPTTHQWKKEKVVFCSTAGINWYPHKPVLNFYIMHPRFSNLLFGNKKQGIDQGRCCHRARNSFKQQGADLTNRIKQYGGYHVESIHCDVQAIGIDWHPYETASLWGYWSTPFQNN